jgi:hypothetical protein
MDPPSADHFLVAQLRCDVATTVFSASCLDSPDPLGKVGGGSMINSAKRGQDVVSVVILGAPETLRVRLGSVKGFQTLRHSMCLAEGDGFRQGIAPSGGSETHRPGGPAGPPRQGHGLPPRGPFPGSKPPPGRPAARPVPAASSPAVGSSRRSASGCVARTPASATRRALSQAEALPGPGRRSARDRARPGQAPGTPPRRSRGHPGRAPGARSRSARPRAPSPQKAGTPGIARSRRRFRAAAGQVFPPSARASRRACRAARSCRCRSARPGRSALPPGCRGRARPTGCAPAPPARRRLRASPRPVHSGSPAR